MGIPARVDIVCHSMGGYVTRYYVRCLTGIKERRKSGKLIEIGVPNQGSSMAEIFNDPVHGPQVINVLSGEFVRQSMCLKKTLMSRDSGSGAGRPGNCNAGLRPDIRQTGTCRKPTDPHSSQALKERPGSLVMMKPGGRHGLETE